MTESIFKGIVLGAQHSAHLAPTPSLGQQLPEGALTAAPDRYLPAQGEDTALKLQERAGPAAACSLSRGVLTPG